MRAYTVSTDAGYEPTEFYFRFGKPARATSWKALKSLESDKAAEMPEPR